MGVIIRQSIITTIISYLGAVIGYVNLFYLFPRFLSPEQVGVMRTMQDAAILMAQFAQFGLAQSIIRFYPRFSGSKEQSQNFFNLIIVLATIAFGVFFLAYLIFESPILSYFQQNAGDFLRYSKRWPSLLEVLPSPHCLVISILDMALTIVAKAER